MRPVIRTLIVDDESVARKVLREELDLMAEIQVVGEAEGGNEALRQITELAPDVVFLGSPNARDERV
jgi:two-component system LytT family response regulator